MSKQNLYSIIALIVIVVIALLIGISSKNKKMVEDNSPEYVESGDTTTVIDSSLDSINLDNSEIDNELDSIDQDLNNL